MTPSISSEAQKTRIKIQTKLFKEPMIMLHIFEYLYFCSMTKKDPWTKLMIYWRLSGTGNLQKKKKSATYLD